MADLLCLAERTCRTSRDRELSLRSTYGEDANRPRPSGRISQGVIRRAGTLAIPTGARYRSASDAHQSYRTWETPSYRRASPTPGALFRTKPPLLAESAKSVRHG